MQNSAENVQSILVVHILNLFHLVVERERRKTHCCANLDVHGTPSRICPELGKLEPS